MSQVFNGGMKYKIAARITAPVAGLHKYALMGIRVIVLRTKRYESQKISPSAATMDMAAPIIASCVRNSKSCCARN